MKIYDNFLTEQDKNYIQSIIKSDRWRFGNKSKAEDANVFWQLDKLEFDTFFNPYLVNKIKELTGDDLVINKIYMNGQNACHQGNLHEDSDWGEQGKTFLIYCNPEWNIEWGGGTYFEQNDTVINYKPYRAVYFNHNIKHFSMPVSRFFNGLRVTLAFKLLKIG
jgi:hypothetical protein